MRVLGIVALGAALSGCVTNNETVQFRTSNPQQQAMMRDGQPALVSRQKSSVVLVRPASRQLQANGRPVFVIGINNFGRAPIDFRVAQVGASQRVGASEYPMQVETFEMLQQEEKNRQVARAILAGVAGTANAYSASQAGYGSTPHPVEELVRSTALPLPLLHRATLPLKTKQCSRQPSSGQQNLAQLEQTVIKDNTLMPGEWYGGQLQLTPPTDQSGAQKVYSIVITVGSDRHVIEVAQGPAGT